MQRSNTDPKLRLPGIQRLSLATVLLTAAALIAATAALLRFQPQISPVDAFTTNASAGDRIDTTDKRASLYSVKAQPNNHGPGSGRQASSHKATKPNPTWEFANSENLRGLLLVTIYAHGNRY